MDGKLKTQKNGFTAVSTNYLSDKNIKAYDKSTDVVDTKVIYIYCKVTNKDSESY